MNYGFLKTACCSPSLKVADCEYNAEQIIASVKEAAKNGAEVLVFPELSITGYTCGDLFFQRTLQESAQKNLLKIIEETSGFNTLIFVGLPVARTEGIYNCAAAVHHGKLLALFAKS